MSYPAVFFGALFGLLTVAIGAFGAHALEQILMDHGRLDTFQTAVDYQALHAIALIMVGLMKSKIDGKLLRVSVYSFVLGIILFSGSLYYLSLTNITSVAMVTPFGGLSFMVGWICILLAVGRGWKDKKTDPST